MTDLFCQCVTSLSFLLSGNRVVWEEVCTEASLLWCRGLISQSSQSVFTLISQVNVITLNQLLY